MSLIRPSLKLDQYECYILMRVQSLEIPRFGFLLTILPRYTQAQTFGLLWRGFPEMDSRASGCSMAYDGML